jgi:hypothetical protein
MDPIDKTLSLDMGDDDCFYRLRRDFEQTRTVIYGHLKSLNVIAQDHRTYGPDIIKELRKNMERWDQEWTTLTVFREDGDAHGMRDQWEPHFLRPDIPLGNFPRLNILDLDIQHRFKNRVSLVQLGA